MPRELPLEIEPIPTERKIDPFGCFGLVAVYLLSISVLLAFEVGRPESISASSALWYIAIDFLAVTGVLVFSIYNNRQSDFPYSKFSLRLDETGLTVRQPKDRQSRHVRWEEMRSFSIEPINARGQAGRWPTLWSEGNTILAQWIGTWPPHDRREAEIEEYIQQCLSAGQTDNIEHNRRGICGQRNTPIFGNKKMSPFYG